MNKQYYTVKDVAAVTGKSHRAIQDACMCNPALAQKVNGSWVFSSNTYNAICAGLLHVTHCREQLLKLRQQRKNKLRTKADLSSVGSVATSFGVIEKTPVKNFFHGHYLHSKEIRFIRWLIKYAYNKTNWFLKIKGMIRGTWKDFYRMSKGLLSEEGIKNVIYFLMTKGFLDNNGLVPTVMRVHDLDKFFDPGFVVKKDKKINGIKFTLNKYL